MSESARMETASLDIYFQSQTNAIKRELKGAGERLHNAELLLEAMRLENLELINEIKSLRSENVALRANNKQNEGSSLNGPSEIEIATSSASTEISSFNPYTLKFEPEEMQESSSQLKDEQSLFNTSNPSNLTPNDLVNVMLSYAEQPSSSSVSPPMQINVHASETPSNHTRNWKRQYYQQKKHRECNYCHKVFFATPGNFKKHYYTHFPKNVFKCEKCDYNSPFKHSYQRHMEKCRGMKNESSEMFLNDEEVQAENLVHLI